jgi:predicted nucleic acid-binding protein
VRLAVDASVALKWVLEEPGSPQALALLASDEHLLLPDFWLNEATNVLWVQVLKGRWRPDEARRGLALLQGAVPPTDTADFGLHTVALDIALAVNHSPYDCLYAAFAIAMGADRLVMADGPFLKAIRRHADPTLSRLPLALGEWAAGAGPGPTGRA